MNKKAITESWRVDVRKPVTGVLGKAKEVVAGKGMLGEMKMRLAGRNIWGQDKIIETDHFLAYKQAYESSDFRKVYLENSISANLREKDPDLVSILSDEFGQDWDTNPATPESILKQSWYIAEAIDRREMHGYRVNNELRGYWEQPRFNPDTHERIFLPEDKGLRRELLVRAEKYNTARVEARARTASMVEEIAEAKGYDFDSKEYIALRNRMREIWENEENERAAGCVYLGSEEGSVLNMYDVDHDIRNRQTPDLDLIIQKLEDVAGVQDQAKLLQTVGIVNEPEVGYRLNIEEKPQSGAYLMVRGRMGQRHHLQTAQRCWQSLVPGSEKNADIVLMNALGLESLVKMESMGREMMVGDIYRQRGLELVEEGEKRTREKAVHLLSDTMEIANEGNPRSLLRFFSESMRELNEMYFLLASATTNLIRMRTQDSGSVLRRAGENMARWIDRVAINTATSVDSVFANMTNRGKRHLNRASASVKSGKVTADLPQLEVEEKKS